MDVILQYGIAFILAFQSLGDWLTIPMKFFTFLGSREFFLLVLPALYWSIDAGLGMRVGVILLFTGSLNEIVKLVFHGPRPYWYGTQVKALSSEETFGLPSGHAQIATGVWGMIAAWIKRLWAWLTAIALILLIGLSRLYLGVHFPHDVLLGWLIGVLVLWAFLRFWDRLANWSKKQSMAAQMGLAFALSILLIAAGLLSLLPLQNWSLPQEWIDNAVKANVEILPAPLAVNDIVGSAATLFGLLAGFSWITSRGGFRSDGGFWQRVLRYFLGLAGTLVLWFGLGALLPHGPDVLSNVLRYVHYTLIGIWISAGAPYLFLRVNLAGKSH